MLPSFRKGGSNYACRCSATNRVHAMTLDLSSYASGPTRQSSSNAGYRYHFTRRHATRCRTGRRGRRAAAGFGNGASFARASATFIKAVAENQALCSFAIFAITVACSVRNGNRRTAVFWTASPICVQHVPARIRR